MPDLEIITKSARLWASIHANTDKGREWIIDHIPDRQASAYARVPAAFVPEYVMKAAREKMVVKVSAAA